MRTLSQTLVLAAVAILLMVCQAAAQDNPRDRLERLRSELDSLSTVLADYRADESTLREAVATLDRQITARSRLIVELQAQRRRELAAVKRYDGRIRDGQQRLGRIRAELTELNEEVEALRGLIGRRAVYLYKQGGHDALRFLAAAESPGDLVRRRVYVRRIARRDEHNLDALRDARARQRTKKQQLEATLAELQAARKARADAAEQARHLEGETEQARMALVEDRHLQRQSLTTVQRERDEVRRDIEQRREAMHRVEELIARLERERTQGEVQEIRIHRLPAEIIVRPVPSFPSFAAGKGKLPWPVKGTITGKYGQVHNRALGTTTNNTGIEIRARAGDEVLAVHEGICRRIMYLRGFGTTIILMHEDGYFTTYSGLEQLYVSEGERVEAGRVLGSLAGRSGEAAQHTFQVFHMGGRANSNTQDPEIWLK